MSKLHVLIKVSGGAITVTPSNVWSSRSKKDEIVWQCEQAFAIDFIPVGPFSKDHFESAPSKNSTSGSVRGLRSNRRHIPARSTRPLHPATTSTQ